MRLGWIAWSVITTVGGTKLEAVPLFHLPDAYHRNGFWPGLDAGLEANGWLDIQGIS